MIFRLVATWSMTSAQTSPSSFWSCSRLSGLISERVYGSTADLYFPTRVTWTPTPYFSKALAKNIGSLAKPGISSTPKGSRITSLPTEAR